MSLNAKFCGCSKEPKAKRGRKVFMGANGAFTFNRNEAHKDFPKHIGKITPESLLKLTPESEHAVAVSLSK